MSDETIISVLLIEDDTKLASLTGKYLEQHGIVVALCEDGNQGLKQALQHNFDVILLDLMLPGMDGITLCRQLRRQKDVPIIMLTARGEEADKVLGLEIGADDYLPKPFSPRELLARIRVQVRRRRGTSGQRRQMIRVGSVTLDTGLREAFQDQKPLGLTSYEFALLYALAENAGRVISRERLMDLAKGCADEAFDRSIDVHISRLRKKLSDDPRQPRLIKTIRSVGYLFLEQVSHAL
ncbi:response regulator [Thermodesulfobacteriota bacterium]